MHTDYIRPAFCPELQLVKVVGKILGFETVSGQKFIRIANFLEDTAPVRVVIFLIEHIKTKFSLEVNDLSRID
jgi:hypothetical protein